MSRDSNALIPKISPGAYFWRGLYRREICVTKSARLILGRNFMSVIYTKGFTEIRREDVDLSKLGHANIKRNRKFSSLITENAILSSQVR